MKHPGERGPGPPHNPGVRELVQGKRRWSSFLNSSHPERNKFPSWHERGYLPHRDEPGLTQFVTFHLADTFPATLVSEWEHLWAIEDDRQKRAALEVYLDKGRGECYLKRPEVADMVETALRIFHEVRYELRAWVIMPNHIHVLFKVDAVPMSQILESWKKHTSNKANRLLRRRGSFWAADYFDTYMRDAEHECKTVHYIESNPTKVGLARFAKDWPWSSARLRDNGGRLCL
jgi:REP element-mobilizing transposase RayT